MQIDLKPTFENFLGFNAGAMAGAVFPAVSGGTDLSVIFSALAGGIVGYAVASCDFPKRTPTC